MSRGFIIEKNVKSKEISLIEYEKNNGYDINPKNKLKKKNSIDVTKVIFMSPTLIEKILNKKIDTEYKKILKLVGEIASDDSDDTGKIVGVLNKIELFKSIIKNKYSKFLLEEQTEKILKRLNIINKEMKKRITYIEEEKEYIENKEKKGKSR